MRFSLFYNTASVVDLLLRNYLSNSMVVADMTVGNGYDSLKILRLIGSGGFLFGFDIQKIAIKKTNNLLKENGFSNFLLFNQSHDRINQLVKEKLDMIIYNLGYLPGGDKTIVTKGDIVVDSLKKSLSILADGGLIVMTLYPGYSSGEDEMNKILSCCSKVDQRLYNVSKVEFVNQANNPPFVVVIEKGKK